MPSLAAKWLAARLHRFEGRYPQWGIRLVAADHLVNFTHENVDVGVRYGAGKYPGLHVEPLMPEDAFPVCSPKLLRPGCRVIREPDDFRYYTLLHDETSRRSEGVPNWRTWLAAPKASRVRADLGPVFGGIHLALEAAIAGHGVVLGLSPLVADDLASGRLVRPIAFEQRSSYSFWLVTSKSSAAHARVRAFLRWAVAEGKRTLGASTVVGG
jgi:LysR family glycine cleavage system transcriptional activator